MSNKEILALNGAKKLQENSVIKNSNSGKINSSDSVPKKVATSSSSPTRKAIRIKTYKALLPYFQKQYPKCFTVPISPLAIGIDK